ncbi:palmitoyltransferase AKR1 [Trichonephila clavipes]|nr:palmitoyltransferase AKR1 [Trichonephila clavipes]
MFNKSVSILRNSCDELTLAAVKFLVEKYSNHILCEKDENGHTAAHWACIGGHFNIVQYMVDIGVSVNIPSSSHIGAYPIHWACVEGHVSIVDLLLRNGVPMDICDINGCTPLITACQHGNSHLVCYLLGRGANKAICDRNGDTALHWASYKEIAKSRRELYRDCMEAGGAAQYCVLINTAAQGSMCALEHCRDEEASHWIPKVAVVFS